MNWRSLNAHLLWAYKGAVMAPTGTYQNEHLVAWRLLAGRVEVMGAETTCHAQAGDWLFPPSRHDQRRFSADARLISLHFQARWADGRMLFEENEPTCCAAADFPELDITANAMLGELEAAFSRPTEYVYEENTDLFTYLKIEATMPRWLAAYADTRLRLGNTLVMQGTSEPRVLKGLEMLGTWPVEESLHAPRLAKQLNLSVSQLNRLFVAETGKTPLRHFEDRRAEVARNLLRNSTLQIKEVAYAVGFKQSSHFSNWFRKKTGSFPLACRRTILPPSKAG